MKKVMLLFILGVVFLSSCTSVPNDYCAIAADCAKMGEPAIDCVGSWQCEDNQCTFVCSENGDVLNTLIAIPANGGVPLTVNFQATVDFRGNDEGYYCAPEIWDFGEGDPLTVVKDCVPFDEGKEVQSVYEQRHTYTKAGVYTTAFTLQDVSSNTFIVTVFEEKEVVCEEDSDCLPAQCCHSTSVVNEAYAPDCIGAVCTQSCEGPLDCGAGHPECQVGKCVIVDDAIY